MNTAVLVIDVQQGLCEGSGAAFDCKGTISRINYVTRKAREVGAPVIFIQHESNSDYLELESNAWQLANGIEVKSGDVKLGKTTPDSFLNTELGNMLTSHGIEELVVCGMHTEFCVDTTIRRALSLGYPVALISDGHTSAGNAAISAEQVIAHHNATLTNISSFEPRVQAIASKDIKYAS